MEAAVALICNPYQVFSGRTGTLDGRHDRRTVVVVIVSAVLASSTGAAHAAIPRPFQNCHQLNAKYPHGLGKVGARDKTTGEPVTNFTRNTYFYLRAMFFNKRLDRDHDGIACEKR